ncbi:MAG: class I SAM-dependent methyltransferase [Leadbetterella sp.]|nr:class I SAM-dependent methyltransferase [Leadbetterella sp.]
MKNWKPVANKYLVQQRSTHFAPQPEELKVYSQLSKKLFQKIFKRKVRPTILVLGATPEFRDWGLSHKCNVLSVDINKEMVAGVKKFLQIKNRKNEKVMIGDWLDLPIADASVDLIVGDVSLNNIPFNKFSLVLSELKRVLREDGMICIKEVIYPDKPIGIPNFKQSVSLYRKNKLTAGEFYVFNRFYNFRTIAYDKKTRRLYAEKVFDEFDRQLKKGLLNQNEHEELNKFRNKIIHTIFQEKEYRKIVLKHFPSMKLYSSKGKKYYKNIFRILLIKN